MWKYLAFREAEIDTMDGFETLKFTLSSCIPPAFFALTINTNDTAWGRKSSRILSSLEFSPIPGVSTMITFP